MQDAYLDNPSRENFWRMYVAAHEMTEMQLLDRCTVSGTNAELSCGAASDFATHKFRAALIGQHLLRIGQLSYDTKFADGPIAFSYLNDDPNFDFVREYLNEHRNTIFLPADMWEIGDRARVMFNKDSADGSFKNTLRELGYPTFVQDSIDPLRTETDEQFALRLPWFWIGFTYDPSFSRMHQSNATKVGEYMIESLKRENMFMHNSFQAHMRLIVNGWVREASVRKTGRNETLDIEYTQPEFKMNYSYFTAYNRTVLRWYEKSRDSVPVPINLREQQEELWHTMTANGFRMSLFLYEDALNSGSDASEINLDPIVAHFATYEPEHDTVDRALIERIRSKSTSGATY